MRRVKDWIIRSLGGLTWQDHLKDMEWIMSANVRNRNQAVMSARRADEWEKRGRCAEAKLAGIVVLNERTCQLVPLRAEIREGMEKFRGSMIPMEELEDWIKRRLAAQLGGGVLAQIGVSRVDDHKNMEYVWACEAYLLKREK